MIGVSQKADSDLPHALSCCEERWKVCSYYTQIQCNYPIWAS